VPENAVFVPGDLDLQTRPSEGPNTSEFGANPFSGSRDRPISYTNKSSAVAEIGDRLATIDMDPKVGSAVWCPFPWRELAPI